jgi:hypothetical protein
VPGTIQMLEMLVQKKKKKNLTETPCPYGACLQIVEIMMDLTNISSKPCE